MVDRCETGPGADEGFDDFRVPAMKGKVEAGTGVPNGEWKREYWLQRGTREEVLSTCWENPTHNRLTFGTRS